MSNECGLLCVWEGWYSDTSTTGRLLQSHRAVCWIWITEWLITDRKGWPKGEQADAERGKILSTTRHEHSPELLLPFPVKRKQGVDGNARHHATDIFIYWTEA